VRILPRVWPIRRGTLFFGEVRRPRPELQRSSRVHWTRCRRSALSGQWWATPRRCRRAGAQAGVHREVPALEVLELEIDGAVFGGQPAGRGRCGGDVNDASRKGVATCRATTHARGVIRLLSIAENMTMTIMERLGPASCRPAGKSSQPRPTDRSRNSAAATSTRRLNNLMGIHFQSAPMGCRRLKVVLTSDSIVTIFIGGNVSK
jgi:hypothetical protein